MATLDEITGSTALRPPPAAARKTTATLGVDDFLRLMTSQLKNQDPLKPLDSTEFVAQLAQFGTVAGVQGMQDSLSTLSTAMRSSQVLSGSTLIGHQVLTAADTALYNGAGVVNGTVDVPAGYPQVQLQVTDSAGQVVRHIALDTSSGVQSFTWNGQNDAGQQVANGNYKIQVIAGGGGSNVSLQTFLMGRVSSVTLDADGTGLTVNTRELGAVALGNVREII